MLDMFSGLFSGSGMNVVLKTGGAILTVLLVIPAIMKLFLVTIDEGSAAIRTRNGKPTIRRARGESRDTSGRSGRAPTGHASGLPDPLLVPDGRTSAPAPRTSRHGSSRERPAISIWSTRHSIGDPSRRATTSGCSSWTS